MRWSWGIPSLLPLYGSLAPTEALSQAPKFESVLLKPPSWMHFHVCLNIGRGKGTACFSFSPLLRYIKDKKSPNAANSKGARGFVRYPPRRTGPSIGMEIQATGVAIYEERHCHTGNGGLCMEKFGSTPSR